ncbi:hypothetical protein HUJ05_004844 [Dendroctonus ponderosae]|nr:hypothetical protein HUJ05_004844 [Dendroctonus ponderosae]
MLVDLGDANKSWERPRVPSGTCLAGGKVPWEAPVCANRTRFSCRSIKTLVNTKPDKILLQHSGVHSMKYRAKYSQLECLITDNLENEHLNSYWNFEVRQRKPKSSSNSRINKQETESSREEHRRAAEEFFDEKALFNLFLEGPYFWVKKSDCAHPSTMGNEVSCLLKANMKSYNTIQLKPFMIQFQFYNIQFLRNLQVLVGFGDRGLLGNCYPSQLTRPQHDQIFVGWVEKNQDALSRGYQRSSGPDFYIFDKTSDRYDDDTSLASSATRPLVAFLLQGSDKIAVTYASGARDDVTTRRSIFGASRRTSPNGLNALSARQRSSNLRKRGDMHENRWAFELSLQKNVEASISRDFKSIESASMRRMSKYWQTIARKEYPTKSRLFTNKFTVQGVRAIAGNMLRTRISRALWIKPYSTRTIYPGAIYVRVNLTNSTLVRCGIARAMHGITRNKTQQHIQHFAIMHSTAIAIAHLPKELRGTAFTGSCCAVEFKTGTCNFKGDLKYRGFQVRFVVKNVNYDAVIIKSRAATLNKEYKKYVYTNGNYLRT